MIERLLGHLYDAISKEPDAELMLRVRCDGSDLAWTVENDILTLSPVGGTALPQIIPLSGFTVASLGDYIASKDGYSVLYSALEYAHFKAFILVPGRGHSASSNGDHLRGYTSIAWAYLHAVGAELVEAKTQIGEMLRQMIMTLADGEWLDFWGSYYGVPRLSGELDADYSARIIIEVLRPRVNHLAIEQAIESIINEPVRVVEPWKSIFTLSGTSALSGAHKIQNRNFWNFCTLEIQSEAAPERLRAIAERNKAAGVKLWYAQLEHMLVEPGDNPPLVRYEEQAHFWPTSIWQTVLSSPPPVLSRDKRLYYSREQSSHWLLDARPGVYLVGGVFVPVLYDANGVKHNPLQALIDTVALYRLDASDASTEPHPLLSSQQWMLNELEALGYQVDDDYVQLSPAVLNLGFLLVDYWQES